MKIPSALPVDILWVIDTSASMCDLQQKVQDGMNALTLAFSGLNYDVHMGCITVSMLTQGESGELQAQVGAAKYVTGFSATSIETFKANCPIKCDGHPYELPGTSMVTALAMSQPGLPNEGFLRDEASFSAIVITDEEDGSASPLIADPQHFLHYLYNTPQDVVDKLTAFKQGDVNRVNYNLIGHIYPDPDGRPTILDSCYDTEFDAQATKAMEAIDLLTAQKTNGKVGGSKIDICTTANYSAILPSLVNTALETKITAVTFIDLSGSGFEPNPASLRIKLADGTIVTSGYSYDSNQKRVIFEDPNLQTSTGEVCFAPVIGEQ